MVGARDFVSGMKGVELANLDLARSGQTVAGATNGRLGFAIKCTRERIVLDVEQPPPVLVPQSKTMEVALGAAGILAPQGFYDLGDWIEAMKIQIFAQVRPARMFSALAPDIDDDERLLQQTFSDNPFREQRIRVVIEFHFVLSCTPVIGQFGVGRQNSS